MAARPGTYSSWSEVSMVKAMQAVESEGLRLGMQQKCMVSPNQR